MKKLTIGLTLLVGIFLCGNAFAATYVEEFLGGNQSFDLKDESYKATFNFDMTATGGKAELTTTTKDWLGRSTTKLVDSKNPTLDETEFNLGDGIESAVLSIVFGSKDTEREKATIKSGIYDGNKIIAEQEYKLGKWGLCTGYVYETATLDIDLTPYSQYLEDGKFTAIVLSLNMGCFAPENDFYIEFASLTIVTKDNPVTNQPVPEPATLFLMGSGLAGLAGLRRRKAAKK